MCIYEKVLKRHINMYHGKRIKLCHFECNFCDENVGTNNKFFKSSKQTQTQTDLISTGEECNGEGSIGNELDWHMSNMHWWSVEKTYEEMVKSYISSQVLQDL
jgi:hypothetical protein